MKILDRQVLVILIAIAAFPFGSILQFSFGFAILDVYELLLIYLFLICVFMILKRGGQKAGIALMVASIAVFASYLILSTLIFEATFQAAVQQTRFFFPFVVATTLLSTINYGNSRIVLNRISLAVGFSAFFAIFLHIFFRDTVGEMLSTNEEAAAIVTEGGRMYWAGASLSFFAIAAMILTDKYKTRFYFLIILIFFAILLTQSRTLAFAFVFFLLICLVYFKEKVSMLFYMVLVLAVGGFLFFVIANEEMRILFYTRFFGGDDISTEFENAFFIGRSLNYEQYYSKFIASFPFGQGLGHPLSVTLLEDEIYTSDISIVSFVLPLGVFGILLLIGYLKVVLKFFSAFRREFPSSKAPKVYVLMIFVTLFASLNVDMYSRNIFVVYLAYFASLHFQSTRMDRNAINFARINND